MNSILKPFLENHIKSYELDGNESSSFEHLTNYLSARNYLSRHFDPSELSLGKGEVGIDGVAIIVNDTLITSISQIEEFFNGKSDVSVCLLFTQAKSSESIDISMISHFITCVKDFITDARINMNDKAREYMKIYKYIVSHPTQLSKNPDLHLFFMYTGVNNDDQNRKIIIEKQIEEIKKLAFFDEITFSLYDSNKIVAAYRSIKNSIKKSIEMIDCAVLPQIANVTESYIGIARCNDFIKLITNDDGAIISNLFEDNVRYFQGQNTINAEIQATLRNEETQDEFAVLNNGVTIVAKELRRTGNTFTINNFQVINGCQTSFVLYENRARLSNSASIIIKLISTTDKNISDSIVKTTNRQTPVLNEAFETLRDFHKNLEYAYEAYPIENRLYYERRSKQYDAADISKNKIVSFPFQTAAYVAVFLGEPQSTHRYYGELLKSYNNRIYKDDDILEQYCIASIIVYTVDNYLKRKSLYAQYKEYRFHISFILRCLAADTPMPKPNSKAMKKYCAVIFDKVKDDTWFSNNIEYACKIINDIISSKKIMEKDGNAIYRTRDFTSRILSELGLTVENSSTTTEQPKLIKGKKVRCKIKNWNTSFVYVELIDYKQNGSIHIKEITGNYIYDIGEVLQENQEVEAVILDDTPNPVFGYCLSMIKAQTKKVTIES